MTPLRLLSALFATLSLPWGVQAAPNAVPPSRAEPNVPLVSAVPLDLSISQPIVQRIDNNKRGCGPAESPACNNPCKGYSTGGIIADANVYSDSKCQKLIKHISIAIPCPYSFCTGDMTCAGPLGDGLPNDVWIKANGGFDGDAKLDITKGTNCPAGGSGGTKVQIHGRGSCVQLQNVKPNMGLSFWPCGSYDIDRRGGNSSVSEPPSPAREEPIRRRAEGAAMMIGRETKPKCKTFDADPRTTWDTNAYTPNKKLSARIDCSNSQSDCPITQAYAKTVTWTTTWNVGVDVSIGKVFGLSASSSGSYAESTTETITLDHSVPKGQIGYLTGYTLAAKVPGWYRDCGNGYDYRGSALIPKVNGATFDVQLTE
ncbi:uncharacterized protein LOC62_02G002245 [Vanrija pseudolonga]|uniref:Expansin-like EG45 domain-containing protein n=1 Tax=Vanrija pseudolonga TaxID=143232 RepID=A0AAF1BIF8_9TREE|nr:hypothetical protein LOC62_02G002245 [Vanrija pseudolonga]